VHHPLTPKRPTSATSIVYDAARNRVYSVNQDNDTVTSIDARTLQKVAELAVYREPESLALTPDGKLWIVPPGRLRRRRRRSGSLRRRARLSPALRVAARRRRR
jgi:YVTN family beta-propeller protein